jgi:hypothetical protein
VPLAQFRNLGRTQYWQEMGSLSRAFSSEDPTDCRGKGRRRKEGEADFIILLRGQRSKVQGEGLERVLGGMGLRDGKSRQPVSGPGTVAQSTINGPPASPHRPPFISNLDHRRLSLFHRPEADSGS